jgi:hypothetical protein
VVKREADIVISCVVYPWTKKPTMRSYLLVSVAGAKRDHEYRRRIYRIERRVGGIVRVLLMLFVGGVGRRISGASSSVMCPATQVSLNFVGSPSHNPSNMAPTTCTSIYAELGSKG